jgi:hypothetical protein
MNTNILKRARETSPGAPSGRRAAGAAWTAVLLLLATTNLRAGVRNGVVVGSVCGGGVAPYYGYVEGNPVNSTDAKFNTPIGLALDSTGNYLFVADYGNNVVRVVQLSSSPSPANHSYFTYTFAPIPSLTPPGAIANPVGVALDADDNLYILNRGNGKNGSVVGFNQWGYFLGTNSIALTNANAIALVDAGNIYVTASNTLIRITFPGGFTTNIATVANAGASLQGLVVMDGGMIAACDSGRHGICLINPTNGAVSDLTGFNGAGDNADIWANTPNFPVTKANARFNHPHGLAKAGQNMLIVADYDNNRVKAVDSFGTVTNLYGVSSNLWYTGPGTSVWPGWWDGNVTVPDAVGDVEARLPNGVLFAPNGTVYVTEDYYHLIRMVTANLPQPLPPPPGAPTILTSLADCGQVSLTWSTSTGATNYNVKRAASGSGPYTTITNTSSTSYTDTSVLSGTTYYYVVSAVGTGGESPNSAPVSATPSPPPAPTILTVLTNFYNQVTLTWSTVPCPGVTYYVKRSPSTNGPYTIIATAPTTSYTDTGLLDGTTHYYVVSAFNGGGESSDSAEVSATTRCHPVPDPQIGYVDFPFPTYTSVFHPVSSYIAYNDTVLVIKGTPGSGTYYTYGYTTNAAAVANPTPASASIPSDYQDGLYPGPVVQYTISQVAPFLTVKAIGTKADCSPDSAVATTLFQFKTGNPNINGINAAQFTISDITANAHLYYTLDSTDPSPTNGFDLGTVDSPTNVWTVGFAITSNTLFKVRAFRDNYQASAIVNNLFLLSNFVPKSRIDPNSGYYPMGQTITVASHNPRVYYTVDGSDPTTNSLSVTMSNNVGFIKWFNSTNDLRSLRVKAFNASGASDTVAGQPVTTNTIGIPPDFNQAIYAGIGSQIVVPVVVNLRTNTVIQSCQFRVELSANGSAQPISTNSFQALSLSGSPSDFIPLAWPVLAGASGSLTVSNYSVGSTNGLEIAALGPNAMTFQNFAVVALLRIAIPYGTNTHEGDSYALAVSYPSATADGWSDSIPLTPMAPATILVTNITYKVGDSASMSGGWSVSGGWYNAGGFGNGDLDNSDANLAFNAALGMRVPYAFSDVFNAMDAYPVDAAGFVGGDGLIRYLDWNVILQRSLRLDTNNWARAWSPGGNLVDFPTTLTGSDAMPKDLQPKSPPPWPWYRQALIGAVSTGNAVPGGTVNVPVYVKLSDGATLSGVQFRAVVTPQGDAPSLTQAPQLSLASGVPGPTLRQSFKASDAGFGWALGSFNYLSRSSNFLGWVTFTIPATAQSGQTYSVSFANADGAPNLSVQYDFETRSAWVVVGSSAPSASICSDEWKVHFFGSLDNPSAGDLPDADGDGVPNWIEYLAGTDPTDPKSRLQLSGSVTPAGKAQSQMALHWLTAPGKAYEVQWASNLSGGLWSTLAAVSGDGTIASRSDTNLTATVRYYRLHVLP